MKINNRQQVLAILAIVAVSLLVADKFIITPLIAAWKSNSAEIVKLNKSISQGRVLLDREKIIKEGWESMRTNTLPANQSAAENEVLKAFDRWSQDSRISVSSIKPQWRRSEEDYMLLECRADAAGSMDAVTKFLFDMEKDPLALRVESVEITARDNEGQQLALGVQVSGLVLTPEDKR